MDLIITNNHQTKGNTTYSPILIYLPNIAQALVIVHAIAIVVASYCAVT
jgi:hypothetical protein